MWKEWNWNCPMFNETFNGCFKSWTRIEWKCCKNKRIQNDLYPARTREPQSPSAPLVDIKIDKQKDRFSSLKRKSRILKWEWIRGRIKISRNKYFQKKSKLKFRMFQVQQKKIVHSSSLSWFLQRATIISDPSRDPSFVVCFIIESENVWVAIVIILVISTMSHDVWKIIHKWCEDYF